MASNLVEFKNNQKTPKRKKDILSPETIIEQKMIDALRKKKLD